MYQAEARVCGGFPVIVEYTTAPAEPDVGLMSEYIDEMFILTSKGKPAQFIQDKMTEADWQTCENAVWSDLDGRRELAEEGMY